MALLRVGLPEPLAECQRRGLCLIVETGERTVALPPLPGAGRDGVSIEEVDGVWRAGFSAPLELIRDPRARFAVSLDEQPSLQLPSPTNVKARLRVVENGGGDAAGAKTQVKHLLAETIASADREQKRRIALERALDEASQAEATARAEGLRTSGLLAEARLELDWARQQLEAVRAESESEAAQGRGARAALEARVQGLARADEAVRAAVQGLEERLEHERAARAESERRLQLLSEGREAADAEAEARIEKSLKAVRGLEQELAEAEAEVEAREEQLAGEDERQADLQAQVHELSEARDDACAEVEHAQRSLAQARKEIKPRAARRLATAEMRVREERDRVRDFEQRLTKVGKRLAEEASARCAAEENLQRSREQLDRLTHERVETEARLRETVEAGEDERRRRTELELALEHERAWAQERVADERAEVAEELRARVESEKGLEHARGELDRLTQELAEFEEAVGGLERRAAEAQAEAVRERDARAGSDERVRELAQAGEAARAQVEVREEQLAVERERQVELEAQVSELAAERDGARAEVQALELRLVKAETSGKAEAEGLRGQLADAKETARDHAEALDGKLARAQEVARGEIAALTERLDVEREDRAVLIGRLQELTQAREAARAELRALGQQLTDARELAHVAVERLQHSLVQARNEVKPRAARRIAAAERVAQRERERVRELGLGLAEVREQFAEEAAARVAGDQELGRAREQLELLAREGAEAEQALATMHERLGEAEAQAACEREGREACERKAEQLSAAGQIARAAADDAEQRLAEARNVLSEGARATCEQG